MQGEEDKKTKYVTALEDAFSRVMSQDFDRIDHMVSSNRPEFYGKIYNLYRKIQNRQNKIRPFLPLVSEDGYVATFKMIDTRPYLTTYANKDSEYLYNRAIRLLDEYTPSHKEKARAAYRSLVSIDKYFDSYKESEMLADKAIELGMEYVYVTTFVPKHVFLDNYSYNALKSYNLSNIDKDWITFHDFREEGIDYDYEVIVGIEEIILGREKENRNVFHLNKEIQDGLKYVLDKKGNVLKDSLGNDVKEPNFINVTGKVIEIERRKHTDLMANIKIINLHTEKIVDEIPIEAHIDYDGFSCRYRGDKRALNKKYKGRLDQYLEPFPTDEEMIYEGIINIAKEARRKIRKEFS